MNASRIWKTLAAGLCGSAAQSSLMLLKSHMGWLPSFQPYHELQQALSQLFAVSSIRWSRGRFR